MNNLRTLRADKFLILYKQKPKTLTSLDSMGMITEATDQISITQSNRANDQAIVAGTDKRDSSPDTLLRHTTIQKTKKKRKNEVAEAARLSMLAKQGGE